MPEIGAPVSQIQRSLNKVKMAPKNGQSGLSKEQILEKVSGKKILGRGRAQVGKKNRNKIGKNEFLKILSHQMQNQDPMNPMDQNKFAADLAQFSQLEQLTNMNSKFDNLQGNSKIEKKFFAANFIGKTVLSNGNSLETKKDGEHANLRFNIDKKAENVIVKVMDSKNNVTNQFRMENINAGSHSLLWDGKALDGFDAPAGEYRIAVQAWDKNLQAIPVSTKQEGVVQSVSFEGDEPILDLGNRKVSLRDVSSFHLGLAKKLPSMKQASKKYEGAQAAPMKELR